MSGSAPVSSWCLLGIRISSASADEIVASFTSEPAPGGTPAIVMCANLHSVATASRDREFHNALRQATHVTADGAPLRLAGRLLGENIGPRVTGYDVFECLMRKLSASHGTALFVGSTPEVLAAIGSRAAIDYPGVSVHWLSPPFGDLAGAPTNRIVQATCDLRPDVVFVGMSAPKQETWAALNAAALETRAVVCVGAVFDYYAGTLRRAPPVLRRYGLEWCFRLAQEPRRVWRKYFVSGPIFAGLVCAEWFARRLRRAG